MTIMSELQKAGFISIGSACADIDGQREEALLSFYNQVQHDGDVSYDLWTEGSEAWKEGYAQAKGCDPKDNKVSVAFNAFTSDLKTQYDIVKPAKTDNADSVKKAEKRAEAKAKLEKMKEQPMEELLSMVDTLLKNHTKKNIAEAGKIQGIIEAKRKDDLADVLEEIKDLQKEAKDLINNCNNKDRLNHIIQLLSGQFE
jgi:flagellar motility protein MotE (MotC chaperone)